MLLLGSIVLLLIGLFMLCFPAVFYELTESWKTTSSDTPSTLYKWHIRIGGIVCTLIGCVGLITTIVL